MDRSHQRLNLLGYNWCKPETRQHKLNFFQSRKGANFGVSFFSEVSGTRQTFLHPLRFVCSNASSMTSIGFLTAFLLGFFRPQISPAPHQVLKNSASCYGCVEPTVVVVMLVFFSGGLCCCGTKLCVSRGSQPPHPK